MAEHRQRAIQKAGEGIESILGRPFACETELEDLYDTARAETLQEARQEIKKQIALWILR